jgi:hypothetical protein
MAQNNLSTTITQLDVSNVTIARRIGSFSDTAPSVGEFISGILTGVGQVTVTFPTNITQLRQLYLKNTHVTATITVVWTPTTASEQTVAVLGPGDVIILWSQATGTTKGISTLKLTANTSNTTYEMFLGG